ncbi:4278_t:CDS:2, partial [Cetraspora pellucida]
LVAENDILRQKNTEIKSENIELKTENAKLKQALKEHESRFMKLEQNDKDTALENAKLKVRTNLHCNKSETCGYTIDTLAINISDNTSNSDICQELSSQYSTSSVCTESKSLEDKEIDEFLGSTYKEQVSNKIIQSIKEKKLLDQELLSTSNNNTPNILREQSLIQKKCQEISITKNHKKSSDQIFDMSSNKISKQNIELINSPDKLLTNLIVEQKLQQQIAMSTGGNNSAMVVENSMQDIDISINNLSPVSAQTIICIFQKAIRSVGKKKAISLVYHEIKQLLPDITDVNLRHKILKSRKIRTLFSAVEIEKIRQVSYSANAISSLSYTQIQNIINYINERTFDSNIPLTKKILKKDIITENGKQLLETEMGIPIKSHVSSKNYPEIKVSASFNPTHNHAYFHNKILGQYPDIYREFSSEKFDYYRIIDKSLCLACKSSHRDEKNIRGRYEARSYFIKCGQQEIEITSETSESTQSKNADNHIIQDSSLVMTSNKICTFSIFKTDSNKNHLHQYIIEHGINPKEFSIITEAEKNRKEDSRKYRKFLTDRDRLVSEELLRQDILKSGLSTAWLDDLMEEWEKIYA